MVPALWDSHMPPPQAEPQHTQNPQWSSQAQLCLRAPPQAAFGGRWAVNAGSQAEEGAGVSPCPAGWREQLSGAARGGSPAWLCPGYGWPARGCRALKEMFLFMQHCQISSASWHGVTALMPPCLSLLTPISFYHRAAPGSFSAGFMFQPDCV